MAKKPKHNKTEGGHMARQAEQNPTAGKINKTPAPTLTRNTGGTSYGQTSDTNTPSSVAPGVPQPVSILGQNLRDSVSDSAMPQVLARGTARVDSAISDQLRTITGAPPPAHGMKRQQSDYPGIAAQLPATTKSSDAQPIRKAPA